MTIAAQNVIASFEALPDADKHQAVVQILRRYSGEIEGDLSEDALVEAADELFRTLDADEAGDASR